ncbi:MAG: TIGR03790 family protein [Duganella sp.]
MRTGQWVMAAVMGGASLAAAAQTIRPAGAERLQAAQLALVVNDAEPDSIAVAELYRKAHHVPEANIVHVRIPGKPRRLSARYFAELRQEIDAQLPPQTRAILMVWTAPYAVECNSITSAMSNGFDADQCSKPCGPGKPTAFFDAPQLANVRLSMLLPIDTPELARHVIERGATRTFSLPKAGAYFLNTSDQARSSRARFFPPSGVVRQKEVTIYNRNADVLEGVQDIMLYHTGLVRVPKLDTLRFLPGALADHLTSTGGDLLGDAQMSSLQWLQAGATASYGTVSEPCNYWQKFPQSTVLLKQYLSGRTAIEAYWSSVAWPAQGLFIGDPLAAPYAR